MRCVRGCLIVLLSCLLVPTLLPASDALEQVLEATCRIADKNSSGTCFFIAAEPREGTSAVYLVTAAHVLEGIDGDQAQLVVRSGQAEGSIARREISIPVREGKQPKWKRKENLDVAVMRCELPADALVKPLPFSALLTEEQLAQKLVRVGQEVWIAGFPAKLEANDKGWAVLRRGSIATHPLTPLSSAKTFLADAKTFGGDSGAAVVAVIDNQPLVVGVISGVHRQTDRIGGPFIETVTHMPLGLAIIVQAPFARELIGELAGK